MEYLYVFVEFPQLVIGLVWPRRCAGKFRKPFHSLHFSWTGSRQVYAYGLITGLINLLLFLVPDFCSHALQVWGGGWGGVGHVSIHVKLNTLWMLR